MSGPVNRTRPLTMVLGSLMAVGPLSIDLYLPSFPLIAVSLAVAPTSVELSLAAFFSGFALGQPVYGRLADRWGRRPTVLCGLSLYVVASLACAGAQSLAVLITARFIQALGGCAGIVVARAVVRDRYETREAARVFSLLMLVMGVAPILAPLLGGAISQAAGWRALFVVLAVTGVMCGGAVFKLLPETLRSATASGHGSRCSRTGHSSGMPWPVVSPTRGCSRISPGLRLSFLTSSACLRSISAGCLVRTPRR